MLINQSIIHKKRITKSINLRFHHTIDNDIQTDGHSNNRLDTNLRHKIQNTDQYLDRHLFMFIS